MGTTSERVPTSLREFIESEINRRGISMREFAELVGTTHGTISRLVDPRNQNTAVSVELILKLARSTGTNAFTLLTLVYPELVQDAEFYARARIDVALLAERIERLPPAVRDIVDGLILQYSTLKDAREDVNDSDAMG